MTFVNEYIPETDYKKYDFDGLNKRPKEHSGTTPTDFWAIDREADIWLRKFYTEMDHTALRGGYTGISVWDFYWKGHLMLIKIKAIAGGGGVGLPSWSRKKLLNINLPTTLEDRREGILKDLESAFAAYKDGGVLSSSSSYFFMLEV
jgi:hypothetical protein